MSEPQFDSKLNEYVATTSTGAEVYGQTRRECYERLCEANRVAIEHARNDAKTVGPVVVKTTGGDVMIEGDRITNAHCSNCHTGWPPRFFFGAIVCNCGHVIARRGEVTCALCNAVLPLDSESFLCADCAEHEMFQDADYRAEKEQARRPL